MKDFQSLSVWQKGHALTLSLYRETAAFPKHELYGLVSQMRRAGSSIPTNIAEGCGRGTDPDFARFLQLAMGSACELEYHLLLARDLQYLNDEMYVGLTNAATEIKRMLTALIQKVRGDSQKLNADS